MKQYTNKQKIIQKQEIKINLGHSKGKNQQRNEPNLFKRQRITQKLIINDYPKQSQVNKSSNSSNSLAKWIYRNSQSSSKDKIPMEINKRQFKSYIETNFTKQIQQKLLNIKISKDICFKCKQDIHHKYNGNQYVINGNQYCQKCYQQSVNQDNGKQKKIQLQKYNSINVKKPIFSDRKNFLKMTDTKRYKQIPQYLICPISQELMENPFIITSCGHTFNQKTIKEWLIKSNFCPICKKQANQSQLQKNFIVIDMLAEYQKSKIRI